MYNFAHNVLHKGNSSGHRGDAWPLLPLSRGSEVRNIPGVVLHGLSARAVPLCPGVGHLCSGSGLGRAAQSPRRRAGRPKLFLRQEFPSGGSFRKRKSLKSLNKVRSELGGFVQKVTRVCAEGYPGLCRRLPRFVQAAQTPLIICMSRSALMRQCSAK